MLEFADALRRAGLNIDRPEMDGKLHRVAVEGDRGREKSGAYRGHLDGVAAGFIQNFKTGEKMKWRQGGTIRQSENANAAEVIRERETRKTMQDEQRTRQHEAAAQTAQTHFGIALGRLPTRILTLFVKELTGRISEYVLLGRRSRFQTARMEHAR